MGLWKLRGELKPCASVMGTPSVAETIIVSTLWKWAARTARGARCHFTPAHGERGPLEVRWRTVAQRVAAVGNTTPGLRRSKPPCRPAAGCVRRRRRGGRARWDRGARGLWELRWAGAAPQTENPPGRQSNKTIFTPLMTAVYFLSLFWCIHA